MVTLWQYIVAITVTLVIDRFKHRTFFLVGSGGTLVTFICWTIAAQQYIEKGSMPAGRMVLACIFIFQAFYTCAWTNLVVTYPLEIAMYQMPSKTWAFVVLTIQVASIFGRYVNPVGLQNIGWKFYIYYCVWVAFVFVIVYFFFVETSGPTLEKLADLLEGDGTKKMVEKMQNIDEKEHRHVEEEKSA